MLFYQPPEWKKTKYPPGQFPTKQENELYNHPELWPFSICLNVSRPEESIQLSTSFIFFYTQAQNLPPLYSFIYCIWFFGATKKKINPSSIWQSLLVTGTDTVFLTGKDSKHSYISFLSRK